MNNAYANTTQRLILLILISATIGLIAKPMLPWLYVEKDETEKYYFSENEIRVLKGENKYFENMDNDLRKIGLCFWLTLIVGIIALIGIALYKTEKYELNGCVLLILGSFIIIFSILIVIYHWYYINEIEDYKIHLTGYGDKSYTVAYYYNFIPLFMSILLLAFSFAYIVMVLPTAGRTIYISVTSGYVYADEQVEYGKYPQMPPKFDMQTGPYPQSKRFEPIPPPSYISEIPQPYESPKSEYETKISKPIEEIIEIWKNKLSNGEISKETYKEIERALLRRKT